MQGKLGWYFVFHISKHAKPVDAKMIGKLLQSTVGAVVFKDSDGYTAILRGLRVQLSEGGRMKMGEVGLTVMEEALGINSVDHFGNFFDDISGTTIDDQAVRDARAEEMVEVYKHEVDTKVSTAKACELTGRPPI